MARKLNGESTKFEPGMVVGSMDRPEVASCETEEAEAAPVESTPSFVVLEDNFGWMENGCTMMFHAHQIVHDQSLVRELLKRSAPLLRGQA
jgi:hypothetical protein